MLAARATTETARHLGKRISGQVLIGPNTCSSDHYGVSVLLRASWTRAEAGASLAIARHGKSRHLSELARTREHRI
jgi:hypothetical protein